MNSIRPHENNGLSSLCIMLVSSLAPVRPWIRSNSGSSSVDMKLSFGVGEKPNRACLRLQRVCTRVRCKYAVCAFGIWKETLLRNSFICCGLFDI